jgi:hypothetical protein
MPVDFFVLHGTSLRCREVPKELLAEERQKKLGSDLYDRLVVRENVIASTPPTDKKFAKRVYGDTLVNLIVDLMNEMGGANREKRRALVDDFTQKLILCYDKYEVDSATRFLYMFTKSTDYTYMLKCVMAVYESIEARTYKVRYPVIDGPTPNVIGVLQTTTNVSALNGSELTMAQVLEACAALMVEIPFETYSPILTVSAAPLAVCVVEFMNNMLTATDLFTRYKHVSELHIFLVESKCDADTVLSALQAVYDSFGYLFPDGIPFQCYVPLFNAAVLGRVLAEKNDYRGWFLIGRTAAHDSKRRGEERDKEWQEEEDYIRGLTDVPPEKKKKRCV